jgi:hypothetical protein
MSILGDSTIKELSELLELLGSEEFVVENDFDTYRVSLLFLLSLVYDPETELLYPEKIPGIPIVDLGTKISNFSVSLSSSRMLLALIDSPSIEISFIDLISSFGTVNTLTLSIQQNVIFSWGGGIKWVEGISLDIANAGDEYVLHISTKGDSQSDIVINFVKVFAIDDDDSDI